MTSPYSEPFFDLLSYARRGPDRRDRVTSTDPAHIGRTAGRTPEVMVKVLSRGANDLAAVRKHLDYIGRKGKVDLETDDAEQSGICERPFRQLGSRAGRVPGGVDA